MYGKSMAATVSLRIIPNLIPRRPILVQKVRKLYARKIAIDFPDLIKKCPSVIPKCLIMLNISCATCNRLTSEVFKFMVQVSNNRTPRPSFYLIPNKRLLVKC